MALDGPPLACYTRVNEAGELLGVDHLARNTAQGNWFADCAFLNVLRVKAPEFSNLLQSVVDAIEAEREAKYAEEQGSSYREA
jgi:hypothetical protein